MTQMNLLPNAESGKQTKSQNRDRSRSARKSAEAGGNLQDPSAETNATVEISKCELSLSSQNDLLPMLFSRFLESEHHCKLANDEKATIFAEAKAAGLDAGALRAAFRQRVRELDKPDAVQKHDSFNSLARSYLCALRGHQDPMAASPAESSDALPWPCVAPEARSEPLARSRTREEASVTQVNKEPKLSNTQDIPVAQTRLSELDDEPEIPECLRAKKQLRP